MAQFTERTRTTSRKQFVLPSTTTWVEVEKVLSVIRQRLPHRTLSDNDVVVFSDEDGNIVFAYDAELEHRR